MKTKRRKASHEIPSTTLRFGRDDICIMYEVKTKQFEGPLHLLVELINEQKMDVTKLSLVEVTDDFLAYVERKDKISLANLSEFLAVASQLILIKSKALLPLFELNNEEEEEIKDLEGRLLEYQRFQNAAEQLGELYRNNKIYFSKDEEKGQLFGFVAPDIKVIDLKKTYERILQEIPTKQDLAEEVLEEIVSLEEKISELKDSIEKRMKMAFHETVGEAAEKVDVIVTFLAMLEMVKQKVVSVDQDKLYGEIIISRQKETKAK